MKNILSIVPYRILPALSGGQKGIALFYKYFVQQGNVVCVGVKSNDTENTLGIRLLSFFSTSKLRYINLFYFFKLKEIAKKNNVEIVIVEQPFMGMFGLMLKFFCKKKLIIHSHNIEGLRFKNLGKWWWRIMYTYEKTLHRSADFSFFINEEDRIYAINNFHLQENKTTVITYGIEVEKPLTIDEKQEAAKHLKQSFDIPQTQTTLLFNGVFNYKPNDEALYILVKKIMPLLLSKSKDFTLIICGKNIPDDIKNYQSENIIIKGFVEDINVVFKGAEIFLNPIWLGGGIKTKLVEALSYGASAVSFESGAIGIPKEIIGEKLSYVKDENIEAFVDAILRQKNNLSITTSQSFYHHFYWGNIAKKAANVLNFI